MDLDIAYADIGRPTHHPADGSKSNRPIPWHSLILPVAAVSGKPPTVEGGWLWFIAGLISLTIGTVWNYSGTSVIPWRKMVRRPDRSRAH